MHIENLELGCSREKSNTCRRAREGTLLDPKTREVVMEGG